MRSFINSFWPFLYRPFKSATTQRRSRLQHGYCIGVSRRCAQATAGKGLAQGPYVADRAGVEPTTPRLKVILSTKASPRPTNNGSHESFNACINGRSSDIPMALDLPLRYSYKLANHREAMAVREGKPGHGPIQFGCRLWLSRQRRNKREILGNMLNWSLP